MVRTIVGGTYQPSEWEKPIQSNTTQQHSNKTERRVSMYAETHHHTIIFSPAVLLTEIRACHGHGSGRAGVFADVLFVDVVGNLGHLPGKHLDQGRRPHCVYQRRFVGHPVDVQGGDLARHGVGIFLEITLWREGHEKQPW